MKRARPGHLQGTPIHVQNIGLGPKDRRRTYPTLEHDNYDPGPLAERIRRDKRERSDRSSDDSSSDQDSCGTGSTSEANDIFA